MRSTFRGSLPRRCRVGAVRSSCNSYEAERRPVGAINVKASGGGTAGRMKWRERLSSEHRGRYAGGQGRARAICWPSPATRRRNHSASIGAELGYRYAGSPVICDEPGGPEPNIEAVRADELAGRASAACLARARRAFGARSHQGRLHAAALRQRERRTVAVCKRRSMRIGAPFSVLDLDSEAPRRVYGFDYLLRPARSARGLARQLRCRKSRTGCARRDRTLATR